MTLIDAFLPVFQFRECDWPKLQFASFSEAGSAKLVLNFSTQVLPMDART